MKIALAAPSPVPFLIGGAEKLFMGMFNNFNRLSVHDMEIVKIPCRDQEFWSLMEGYKKFSELNLDHFDMVITTKYPAWMIRHPNHMVYIQHTCRGVYDLYHLSKQSRDWKKEAGKDRKLAELAKILSRKPDQLNFEDLFGELDRLCSIQGSLAKGTFDFPGPLTRKIIHSLDAAALMPGSASRPAGIKSYNAISRTVAKRDGYFPKGVNVKIIHHPSNLENLFPESYDFVFTASRFESLKRIDLLVKAFKKVTGNIRFLIAGTGSQQGYLEALAKDDDRIEFLGFVTDNELVNYYNNALFVPFIPFDEDYGLITIEAMKAKKAILTTSDAGGVTEIVRDKCNGIIARPQEDAISRAMQYLVDHRAKTVKMGEQGYQTVSHINWSNMVCSLSGEQALKVHGSESVKLPETVAIEAESFASPSILVLSTFSVCPPVSGGKLRLYNLYENLAKYYTVTILSLGHADAVTKISDTFTEITVKRTRDFNRLAEKIKAETGVSSDDIAAMEGYRLIPDFVEKSGALMDAAGAVILAHPYLYELVAKTEKPVYYDAPDVEYSQKSAMFDNTKYISLIKSAEQRLCDKARLIYPPSKQDVEKMKALYQADEQKLLVVENGTSAADMDMLPPAEKKALKKRLGIGDRPVAVFAGSMHKPNIDAALYIKTLAKEFPGVLFIVVGSAGDVLEGCPDNLIATGVVTKEEKDVLMQASDIGLNPVVSGSGTNLKLVEYLSHGHVVISTVFGARGMEYEDELFTCTIDDFSKKFGYLIDNLHGFDGVRRKARLLAEHYDWGKISWKLKKRIDQDLNPVSAAG